MTCLPEHAETGPRARDFQTISPETSNFSRHSGHSSTRLCPHVRQSCHYHGFQDKEKGLQGELKCTNYSIFLYSDFNSGMQTKRKVYSANKRRSLRTELLSMQFFIRPVSVCLMTARLGFSSSKDYIRRYSDIL